MKHNFFQNIFTLIVIFLIVASCELDTGFGYSGRYSGKIGGERYIDGVLQPPASDSILVSLNISYRDGLYYVSSQHMPLFDLPLQGADSSFTSSDTFFNGLDSLTTFHKYEFTSSSLYYIDSSHSELNGIIVTDLGRAFMRK